MSVEVEPRGERCRGVCLTVSLTKDVCDVVDVLNVNFEAGVEVGSHINLRARVAAFCCQQLQAVKPINGSLCMSSFNLKIIAPKLPSPQTEYATLTLGRRWKSRLHVRASYFTITTIYFSRTGVISGKWVR